MFPVVRFTSPVFRSCLGFTESDFLTEQSGFNDDENKTIKEKHAMQEGLMRCSFTRSCHQLCSYDSVSVTRQQTCCLDTKYCNSFSFDQRRSDLINSTF